MWRSTGFAASSTVASGGSVAPRGPPVATTLMRCGSATARAVIGLGINVRMPAAFAADITQPWTDLATLLGDDIERTARRFGVVQHQSSRFGQRQAATAANKQRVAQLVFQGADLCG